MAKKVLNFILKYNNDAPKGLTFLIEVFKNSSDVILESFWWFAFSTVLMSCILGRGFVMRPNKMHVGPGEIQEGLGIWRGGYKGATGDKGS
jgi:hypothetical protein